VADICAAVGKKVSDLFPEKPPTQKLRREPISHAIRDLDGTVLCYHKRIYNKDDTKTIWWELPSGKMGLGGKPCEDLPLYGSQHIKKFDKERWVYLCEGEPSTDALLALGAQALGTVTGAPALHGKAAFFPLRGCKVVLWPDNDDNGRTQMQKAKAILQDIAAEVVTLDTRSLPIKGDAVQWVEAQLWAKKTKNELAELLLGNELPGLPVETQPVEQTPLPKKTLKVRTLGELFAMELPPLTPILGEWLTERSLSMVYSKRGTGKTWFCLEIAYAIATGGSFLQWQAKGPRTVLYVDGEMPATRIKGRLAEIHRARGADFQDRFRLLSSDDPENESGIPDLCTKEGQAQIEENLEGVTLLVLDNASCLFRSGDENEAQSWHAAQDWLMSLRRKGLAVLLVHHAGKNGTQRGTSRREDLLDYVIKLQPPEDAKPTDGARFTVTFEKNRHYYGPEIQPFEAKLVVNEQGKSTWVMQDIEAGKRATIAQMLEDGMRVNAIAKEAGVSHGYVSQIKAKLAGQKSSNGRQRGEPVSGYSPYEGEGVTTAGSFPKSQVTTNQRTNRSELENGVSTENHSTTEESGSNRVTNRITNRLTEEDSKSGYYPPQGLTDLLTDSVTTPPKSLTEPVSPSPEAVTNPRSLNPLGGPSPKTYFNGLAAATYPPQTPRK
jgi:putative DNA primase/helicase